MTLFLLTVWVGELSCAPGDFQGRRPYVLRQRSRGALSNHKEWPRKLIPCGLHSPFPADLAHAGLPVEQLLLSGVAFAVVSISHFDFRFGVWGPCPWEVSLRNFPPYVA